MKRWLIALLILITPVMALANWLYLPGPGYSRGGGGGCVTQSSIYSFATLNTNSGDIYDTTIRSFAVVGTGKNLHSVTLTTGSSAQGSATNGKFKILLSTSQDFSGTLIDEFTIDTPGVINTQFSAVSTARPTLANGVTYYVGLYANGATYGERVTLGLDAEVGKVIYHVPSIGGTVIVSSVDYTPMGSVMVCDD